jgi:Ca2+-binding EF-hand superfamily protein
MTAISGASRSAAATSPRQSPSDVHRVASSAQETELRTKLAAHVRDRFGGDYQRAFRATDADGNGQISRSELKSLLGDAGVGSALTRGAWADGVMDHFDTNRNGGISWNEFQGGLR